MAGNRFIKSMPNRPPAVVQAPGGQMEIDARDWNDFILRMAEAVSKTQQVFPLSMTGNVGAVQNILPLSSTDRGMALGPKIIVAAHTVQHGGILLSYGAGEIIVDDQGAALEYSVDIASGTDISIYHVYVDNENYDDQAAPDYKATTDSQVVAASLHRYRVGKCVMVQNPVAIMQGGTPGPDPIEGGGGGSSGGGGDPIVGGGVSPGYEIP